MIKNDSGKAMRQVVKQFATQDTKDLQQAKKLLESPGVAVQFANLVGAPIEYVLSRKLPARLTKAINTITRKALESALKAAIFSLRANNGSAPSARTKTHKLAVAATGGVGGFFGAAGLAVELPVTTTLMLRSIAEIARSEGEDLSDPSAALACIEVFALGTKSSRDDGAESGYFAVRAVMAQQVASAAEYIAAHGVVNKGAPALVALVATIASRFSVVVSEKVATQSVPVVGAVSGVLLNTLFLSHFQSAARGHFIVRRLERKYGANAVKEHYDKMG